MSLEEILFNLIGQARDRFPDEQLLPLPNKTFDECIVIDRFAGIASFHYHIGEDKSSKASHLYLDDRSN